MKDTLDHPSNFLLSLSFSGSWANRRLHMSAVHTLSSAHSMLTCFPMKPEGETKMFALLVWTNEKIRTRGDATSNFFAVLFCRCFGSIWVSSQLLTNDVILKSWHLLRAFPILHDILTNRTSQNRRRIVVHADDKISPALSLTLLALKRRLDWGGSSRNDD